MTDDQIREFLEHIADFEMLLVERALVKKLGPMTDKEMDRARADCQLTVAQSATKNIKTVEHNFTRLVVFTEQWVEAELQVRVDSKYGELASAAEFRQYMRAFPLNDETRH